jgi:hypothetical protein
VLVPLLGLFDTQPSCAMPLVHWHVPCTIRPYWLLVLKIAIAITQAVLGKRFLAQMPRMEILSTVMPPLALVYCHRVFSITIFSIKWLLQYSVLLQHLQSSTRRI